MLETFRFDYEYEFDYEYDFSAFELMLNMRSSLILEVNRRTARRFDQTTNSCQKFGRKK